MRNRHTLLAAMLLLAGSAPAAGPVSGPLVVSERWPQATNLQNWVRDIMRIEGLANASETAQGKAFFEWVRLYCRMAVGGMIQAHEGAYAKEQYVLDAHKNLFVYGWGYCDTCSRIADAAWSEYKRDNSAAERVVVQNEGAGFHTLYRLRMDGQHGAFDPRYGYYLVDRDNPEARVLDWAEVGNDENILRNKSFQHRSQPFFEYFGKEWTKTLNLRPSYFKDQREWEANGSPLECVFGNGQYQMGTPFHDMDFRLPKGTVIERHWDNSARKFYRPVSPRANRELPFLPAGRFYRVTDTMFDGNWPKHDPNYERAKAYLVTIPKGEGYDAEMEGGKSIGQAWGVMTYQAPLAAEDLDVLAPGSTLEHAPSAPYLRPRDVAAGGSAIFDFYSPYILVDGRLDAEVAGDAALEMRTLEAKPRMASQPDVWSEWQRLPVNGDGVHIELGRPRFNGRDVSIHGVYRFQVRLSVPRRAGRAAPAGLNSLALRLSFEAGIMSLPQIFSGKNTVRFQVRDAEALRGPIQVAYRYQTAHGPQTHRKTLERGDFTGNIATYEINTPGLLRCDSVTISYQ